MTLTEATRALRGSRRGKDALRALEVFLPSLESLTSEQQTAVAELTRRFCAGGPKNTLEAVQAALSSD